MGIEPTPAVLPELENKALWRDGETQV